MGGWVVAMDSQKAHPLLRQGPALLTACFTRLSSRNDPCVNRSGYQ